MQAMPGTFIDLNGRSVLLRAATASDVTSLVRFLSDLKLPTAGVEDWWSDFTVAESDGTLIGVAGIERYADGVLLRSVAVHAAWRSAGLGRALVETVLGRASRAGNRDAYLLTTTAERYFPRLGFTVISRAAVPQSVQQSVEFLEACPASAVVMHRSITPA
jgi:amino-acid N-acetyltransferase